MNTCQFTVVYRTEEGPSLVDYDLDEIESIPELLGRLKYLEAVEGIFVKPVDRDTCATLTVEQAAEL